ncbi:MAG: tyrosine--tRNA ligase [Gammaproteobacteria bacterium]|nr:tyrosine--tRNA ligase [Gammaproteobacteria bacterium]MCY4256543.1 tyrosine--tRNA ligase [Gammaproteobacteria bacterium]
MNSPEQQLRELRRGAVDLVREEELLERLGAGRPLRVKCGFDPTAPDLHLGHVVILTKMRQFQDFGHEVIFLIGDFTGMIGDPSGRSKARPTLTEGKLKENAATYAEQVHRVLDPELTRVEFNSAWMNRLGAADLVRLAGKRTLARMLERDDFKKRFGEGNPIGLHEFMYPIAQGYDSVALEADVELGGTDQTFNLLLGRQIQAEHGQPSQIVLTLPLLEGTDGVQKMSKSLGNHIAIMDPPGEMYGKLMSVSDQLMWRYLDLLSLRTQAELDELRSGVELGGNPRDAKMSLAHELTARFHGDEAAQQAARNFSRRHRHGQAPDDMPVVTIAGADSGVPLGELIRRAGLAKTNAEAMRLIAQGAVRVDGKRVTDRALTLPPESAWVLQVGKRRFVRVMIEDAPSTATGE